MTALQVLQVTRAAGLGVPKFLGTLTLDGKEDLLDLHASHKSAEKRQMKQLK